MHHRFLRPLLLLGAAAILAAPLSAATFADKARAKSGTIDPARLATALQNVARNLTLLQRGMHPATVDRATAASPARALALQDLLARDPDATIRWNERNATPIFLTGSHLASTAPAVGAVTDAAAADATARFLAENSVVLGLDHAAREFTVTRTVRDDLGMTHVRLQQSWHGVPVWGADAIVHLDADGNVTCFNGRYVPSPVSIASVVPTLTAATAAQTALADVRRYAAVTTLTPMERAVLRYDAPVTRTVIFVDRQTQTPRLAWHVTVRPNVVERWEYFVDAAGGAILFAYDNTETDGPATANATDLNGQSQTIHTYQVGSTYYLIDASRAMYNAAASQIPAKPAGALWTITANNTDLQSFFQLQSNDNTWSDASSVSAAFDAGATYEYYRTTHQRNSIDDSGMTIISVIHVTQNGQGMDNAFWNGSLMAYGDGNTDFKPLAGGLDVGAHEMTHGVTEHSANLQYLSQSGALNESMSDVFGAMVDRANWTIGETVCKPGVFPTNTLRDMANPHNGGNQYGDAGWQPATMDEYVTLPETKEGDNGGVHVNSGIPNHAAYLVAQQITREQTEKIYYRALTKYLTRTAQFIDARLALVQAARDLYGDAAANAVKSAFDQVKIFDGSGTGGPGPLPENPGTSWLLRVNYNTQFNDFSLFRVADVPVLLPTDETQVSQANVLTRPAVADDGTAALFVDNARNLHAITGLDGATPTDQVLENSGIWYSCALSRDGKRFAITDVAMDHAIYVFNLAVTPATSQKMTLYVPTTAQGVNSGTVKYAAMMDWDPSGEYILYDCYNTIPSSTDSINYWDVLLLDAWNVHGNAFGSGLVQRVFPPQPQGIDIGNPIFAKNSPNIIAFDALDANTTHSAVLGANLQTGTVGKIADNTYPRVGFPSFSRGDDTVAYTGFNSGNNAPSIFWAPVDGTKIQGRGSPLEWDQFSQVPVWFTVGRRPQNGVAESGARPAGVALTVYPQPVRDQAQLGVTVVRGGPVTIELADILGRRIASVWNGTAAPGTYVLSLDTHVLASGTYEVIARGVAGTVHVPFAVVR